VKITFNNTEIVAILMDYMQSKLPGNYTCELKTYTYDPVCVFESVDDQLTLPGVPDAL
jgi:hypothetical protein